MPALDRRSAEKSNHLFVWRSPLLPGIVFYRGIRVSHPYPKHWHDELHICAYTSGSGYLACRGTSHLLGRGDLVLTPPGEVHENWVASGSSVSYCSAYFDMSQLQAMFHDLEESPAQLPDLSNMFPRHPRLLQGFLRMYHAVEAGTSQLQCDELLRDFFHLLNLSGRSRSTSPTRAQLDHNAVRQARDYIAANFTESISLAQLSLLTNLSPFHLQRIFLQQTGMPPHAYQTQLRINRAKDLLRQRRSLCEIAVTTGFADQSHLTRQFRRLVGVTPGRYAANFKVFPDRKIVQDAVYRSP